MRALPLYPNGVPRAEIEAALPYPRDPNCRLCGLRLGTKTVCMPAELERGPDRESERTLLALSEKPGATEDRAGRPQVGASGLMFRSALRKWWKGPIYYDNSVRCAPGGRETTAKSIEACRGYIRTILSDARPERILALGGASFWSVLGRDPPVFSVRRGYGWVGETPVFLLMNAAAAYRNRFVKRWFLKDLEWALTVPLRELRTRTPWNSFARAVETEADALAAEEEIREADWISYDAEWAGRMYGPDFEILTLAVAPKGADDPFVWGKSALRRPEVLAPLRRILSDPRVPKIAQNGKADQLALLDGLALEVRGTIGDIRLWRRLDDPEAKSRLEVVQELVGMGGGKEENERHLLAAMKRCRKPGLSASDLERIADDYECSVEHVRGVRAAEPRSGESTMDACRPFLHAMVPEDISLRYCATDALSQAKLGELYELRLQEPENAPIKRVWDRLVRPAHEAFVRIERWGIGVDKVALQAVDGLLKRELEKAERYFEQYEALQLFGAEADGTPTKFSPDNHAHVRKLLFDHLKLRPLRITESGLAATSAEDVLEPLSKYHEAPRRILDLRGHRKNYGTYVGQLWRFLAADGRIHPSYNLDGAETGRLSAHEPSFQNFPKDGEFARLIRDVFCAQFDSAWWAVAEGPRGELVDALLAALWPRITTTSTVLLEFDYATLELRVLALLSGDPVMLAIFQAGRDLHLETAKLIAPIFGIDPAEVTKEHFLRARAKVLNFALAYGKTDNSVAAELGIEYEEARKLRAAILGKFSVMAAWLEARVKEAQTTGFVHTWWDGEEARRRPLWRIADDDDAAVSNARNAAVNTPVQGTASDFGLASVGAIVQWVVENAVPAKVVGAVHDSILVECPVEWAAVVARKVIAIMQGWNSGGVPLAVDAKIGWSWGSMLGLKFKGDELLAEVPEGPKDAKVVRLVPVVEHFRRAA